MPTIQRGSLRKVRFLALLACLAALAVAVGGQEAEGEPEAGTPPPVHRDAVAVERATLEAIRAFLREDPVAARRRLAEVEESTRHLDKLADAALGEQIILAAQAFHTTMNRVRELAGKGRLEDAFNQFVWVQRSCVACHGFAREQGLLPPLESGEAPPGEAVSTE